MSEDPCICPDCAQEGWVMTDTQDPDIWAETVDYPDTIESPNHYTIGEREAIDYMRDMGVLEDYCAGNIFKYQQRNIKTITEPHETGTLHTGINIQYTGK